MKEFSTLLDRLTYTPQRNGKLRLMTAYFRTAQDPDRGYALAALTDGLSLRLPVRRLLSDMMAPKIDAELFRLSRDYVGDTAETVALLWPGPSETMTAAVPRLAEIVTTMQSATRAQQPLLLADWLNRLDVTGRWALLKLLTGAPRVGVSARLARTAVAELAAIPVDEVEEIWHGLEPPYADLFAWLEGRGAKPDSAGRPSFRPLMLANPLEDSDRASLDVEAFAVEWKWDGIRVQIVVAGDQVRLYSRAGDDISRAFPELLPVFVGDVVLDGELLVLRDGEVAPFNDLQQRLNRKMISRKHLIDYPAHVRLYDLLIDGAEDLRALPFIERRARLETWHARATPPRTDLSAVFYPESRAALEAIWHGTRGQGIEGLMLKRRASPYLPGRPKSHWYKWKRSALTLDVVMMYAQRGSGKRSSFYSDFTFGAWRDTTDGSRELVPVGKAYSGFTDEELKALDRWIRDHTTERFGPVRAVEPLLVLEVAFDAVQRSGRHKSGVAMRFPRIHRIRWDKPAAEAETLATLEAMIGT
jgi:DNA ligase 1